MSMLPSFRFRGVHGWALAALFVWACGESAGDHSGPLAAGAGASAGDASAGRQAASAGDGGSAGDPCVAAPDSPSCREVPWCGPFGLQEVCGPTPFPLCPTSFADWVVRTSCDSVANLEAYDTKCGGRVLVRHFEHKTESWEFGADDTLLSVLVEGGSLHECFEGGRSSSWLYGAEPCEMVPGTNVDVCLGAGGGGTGGTGAGPGDSGGAAGNAVTAGAAGAP